MKSKNLTRENIYRYLQSYDIRPSVQRLAIMGYLLTHKTHPNVDEIYSNLSKNIPTLSRTTVYNTLKLFVEKGASQMLTIDDNSICFDGDLTPHAHFLCEDCRKIYDIPITEESINHPDEELASFIINDTQLFYRGICPECARKAN